MLLQSTHYSAQLPLIMSLLEPPKLHLQKVSPGPVLDQALECFCLQRLLVVCDGHCQLPEKVRFGFRFLLLVKNVLLQSTEVLQEEHEVLLGLRWCTSRGEQVLYQDGLILWFEAMAAQVEGRRQGKGAALEVVVGVERAKRLMVVPLSERVVGCLAHFYSS